MRRLPLAALALLCLFLAADNVRLRSRPRPSTAALPRAAAPPAEPTADATPTAPKPPPASPAPEAAVSFPVEEQKSATKPALIRYSRLTAAAPASPLNLTEAQKKLIDELRKNRDAQTGVFKEQIARIEEQTEQAIRQFLDPEQAKAYAGSPGAAEAVSPTFTAAEAAPGPPSAYLGVVGSDAPGGGAAIGDVFPDTAALGAGLRTGDVLLEFNGKALSDWAGLAARMREFGPGSSVVLTVRRGETVFQQGVQLGTR